MPPPWKHNRPKPVIGLAGGIGSGKSTIARIFAHLGCQIIDSDADAHHILQTDDVKNQLHAWLSEIHPHPPRNLLPAIFSPDGRIDRKSLGTFVFSNPDRLQRLNNIIHPRVAALREQRMTLFLADPNCRAVIWDMPLLFEVHLHTECDALVFIHASRQNRLARVAAARAWTPHELEKREKFQISLDTKAHLADYCIHNDNDEASTLAQVRLTLSQILSSGL